MANYTDITVLLDRSGSMESIKAAMESGFDEFLTQHRTIPTTRLSLVQFDSQQPCDVVYEERPITDAPRLELLPRSMTPLRDAICLSVDMVGRRLHAKNEADRPNKVLFLIITDGLENASSRYTVEDVKQRIKRQTNAYQWEFVYLGANQNAIVEAGKLGMDLKKALTYDVNRIDQTWNLLASNTAKYVGTAAEMPRSRMSATLNWSNAQRTDVTDDKKTTSKS